MPAGYGNTVWDTWFNATGGTGSIAGTGSIHTYIQGRPYQPPLTPAEILRRQEEAYARQQAALRARAQAHDRAEDLLRLVLTPEQWREYETDGRITVVGSQGRRYRIEPNHMTANVQILGEGDTAVARICAHPLSWTRDGQLPTLDLVVGQVLQLSADEESFLARANVHAGAIPQLAA